MNMDKKNKTQNSLSPFSDCIYEFLEPELRKRGISSISIIEMWKDIMGERLASSLFFDKISVSRNGDKILWLITFSDALALEISYQKPIIIKKINTFLGFDMVKDIKITVNSELSKIEYKKEENVNEVLKTGAKNLDLEIKKELNISIDGVDERLKDAIKNLKVYVESINVQDD